MRKIVITLSLITLALATLQGCAPVVVSGAATGASVMHDRRSTGTALDDQTIELKALHAYINTPQLKEQGNMSATSYNYLVLLTGQADNDEARLKYERTVRGLPMVKRVVNEIQLSPKSTLTEKSKDTWLTSKAKLELFEVKIQGFDPTRVKVVSEKGVIYLMGLVTRAEAEAVVEKIRYLRGVKQVVKVFEYL